MHFYLIYNNSAAGACEGFLNIQKPLPFYRILYFAEIKRFMSTRLVVDSSSELKEMNIPEKANNRKFAKWPAMAISYLFHPVFIPIYVVLFLLYVHPFIYAGASVMEKRNTLAQAMVNYSIFPIVTVLLIRAAGFITSLHLPTQKERMIPLMATMIWYFWIWNVWRNLPDTPKPVVIFSLSIFVGTIAAWLMNIYFKVSLHAISVGVLATFMLYLGFSGDLQSFTFVSIAFLIAGVVCTSRLLVSDHSLGEIYTGFGGGVVSTLIAIWVA
jgi:hypothetical protein